MIDGITFAVEQTQIVLMKKLLLALAFIPALLFSQSKKERKALEAQQKADQQVISNLKTHVQYLAGSKAQAQSNVSTAEANAIEYISNQFKTLGLQPKGTDGFVQPFTVDDGKKIEPSTYLKINDNLLEANKEYFPLSYSAEKKVTGMPAMALRERGVPWFVDLKDWLEDRSKTDGYKIEDAIKKEAAKVASKGATALFLYNSGSIADGLLFNKNDKSATLSIPVIYVTPDGYKKYFNDHSQILDIELNVAFKEQTINGSNVIGYIDNAAPSTIVVGAHYNYVFTDTNHESAKAAKATVSGADDNSSGIAMLIELARMLSASKAKNNNYLFIAFGSYDKGSTAGNYWLENPTITAPLNYMFNLDMVGSYSESKRLSVQGYGSSPIWKEVFTSIPDKKVDVSIDSIGMVLDPCASFYKKGIPELSFSTATHADYSATDEEGKINYAGELQIAKFISRLVEATDSKGKVAFAKIVNDYAPAIKAAEQPETNPVKTAEPLAATAKTAVSLGVIPDKTNSETGLRISGVSPKKLAAKLGLQPGDVLTNLGSYIISDLRSYMHALNNFKTGDKTTLRIKRGKDDKEFAVEF
ncbi:MAG: aminopeptidase [Segetibacter sp.]|nr:aminopeptidase [Segetibacter sp.]